MLDAADVDGSGLLRIVLGAVDVGPGRGVQHEVGREPGGRRVRHVPVGARQPARARERLEQRVPELPAGAGYEDATESRDDRIGVCVLHSSLTRGSSQASDARRGRPGRIARDVVTEEQVGERLEAVRVDAGDVDRDRVLVADVLSERLAGRAVEDDDARRSLEAREQVVLAALVVVQAADRPLARERDVRLHVGCGSRSRGAARGTSRARPRIGGAGSADAATICSPPSRRSACRRRRGRPSACRRRATSPRPASPRARRAARRRGSRR